jgi:hypothetical protein
MAQAEIQNIQKTSLEQFEQRRKKFYEELLEKKKMHEYRESILRQKLKTVKLETAEMAREATPKPKGSNDICIEAMKSGTNRSTYCVAKFSDFNLLNACRLGNDFCHVCCNTEFSGNYTAENLKCRSTVCKNGLVPPDGKEEESANDDKGKKEKKNKREKKDKEENVKEEKDKGDDCRK